MKVVRYSALVVALVFSGFALAQTAQQKSATPISDRERLIGAWRLVSMEEQGADGKMHRITDRKGTLIYTRDGRTAVQIMFPNPETAPSTDYAQAGYEASFGTYEVNEEAHTLTRYVEGSVTRGLVGKHLTRAYQFIEGRLISRSVRPDEHWSVTWEHY
jgi:hypothetical protein